LSGNNLAKLDKQTKIERRAERAHFFVRLQNALVGLSWFAALSRLNSALSKFFDDNKQYFYIAGLAVSIIGFVLNSIKFARAANKNAGKTANFIYKALYMAFSLLTATIMIAVSMTIGGLMLGIGFFVDPLINLSKTIFHGIKWIAAIREKDENQRKYHKIMTLRALSFFLGGALASLGFLALYVVPALPLVATATIAIIGSCIILAPYIAMAVAKVAQLIRGKKPETIEPVEVKKPAEIKIKHASINKNASHFNWHNKDYYGCIAVNEHGTYNDLREDVHKLKKIISSQASKLNGLFIGKHLRFASAQRQQKNDALDFVLLLIDLAEKNEIPQMATKQRPYYINGQPFVYRDHKHLFKKLDDYVVKTYPWAYQSWDRKNGRVEACFNQAYYLIESKKSPSLRPSM
jgi:hypothetical protein